MMLAEKLNDNTIISARPENLSSPLGDEAVILNMESGRYFGLNPTSAFIWGVVQEPTTLSALQQRICDEFDVESEQCRADLHRVLEQMASSGLVELR